MTIHFVPGAVQMLYHPARFLFLLILLHSASPALSQAGPSTSAPLFVDLTAASKLDSVPISLKFGGPCVADINQDGYYDLIFNHHNRDDTHMYLNTGNTTFDIVIDPNTGSPFTPRILDVHGVSVSPFHATGPERLIAFGVGGGGGGRLRPPELYKVSPNAKGGLEIEEVTESFGWTSRNGSNRNVVFMDASLESNAVRRRRGGGPDAIVGLFLRRTMPDIENYGYENLGGGGWALRELEGGIATVRRARLEVTDVEGDGIMELFFIQEMKMFELEGGVGWRWRDITDRVFGDLVRSNDRLTASGAAEFDFDGDGRWDIFIARSRREVTTPVQVGGGETRDWLLRNNGKGGYDEVGAAAGVDLAGNSVGVTVGDLNNDGWTDVVVIREAEADVVWLNQGDGTFRREDGQIPKRDGDVGGNAVAVDYDRDGRVDLIVGHGSGNRERFGPYYILHNELPFKEIGQWLHVRVGDERTGAATSLHAVVTVILGGRRKLIRRVGSRGSQESYGSLLDTLHFGVGNARVIGIRCRWVNGRMQRIQRDLIQLQSVNICGVIH